MNIPDELLAAYIDGELQGAERARVEQAILHDARLAQRVAQVRSSRARRRFDGTLHEPMPQRLLQSARMASRPATAQVIDLARVRAERKRRAERHRLLHSPRVLMAATLLGGLLIGALGERLLGGGAATQYRGGMLLAGGPLVQALDARSSGRGASADLQISASFRTRSGNDCRTFSFSRQAISGTACRELNRWRILTLESSAAPLR